MALWTVECTKPISFSCSIMHFHVEKKICQIVKALWTFFAFQYGICGSGTLVSQTCNFFFLLSNWLVLKTDCYDLTKKETCNRKRKSSTALWTFLCISVWHMWVWYLGEPDDAGNFKCDIAIKKRNVREEESELKYSGRVHSIRIPPHRIILSGCLLSFSDYTAAHFRYIGKFSWTTGCRRDRKCQFLLILSTKNMLT